MSPNAECQVPARVNSDMAIEYAFYAHKTQVTVRKVWKIYWRHCLQWEKWEKVLQIANMRIH